MDANCSNCGAPVTPGLVSCAFCREPVSAEAAQNAIPCPACRKLNQWGATQCAACQAWVVVRCVFCDALSPHTSPSCLSCQEPFQGAMERKAARDAEVQREKTLETVSAVGSVAGSFLGALAGVALGAALDDD
jgi:hypothetical protein